MNPEIDEYLRKADKWREETERLRAIALECGLTEELKWGQPCYTFEESNVVIIQGFKDHCALMFFKGALLKDADGILVRPGKSSQAARRVQFTDMREIVDMEPTLKAYIREAVEVEEAGLEVEFEENPEPIPEELQARLDESPALKAAFEALTPGRQRGYILYISGAKQSKTRASRVARYEQKILDGKGLRD